MTSQMAERVRPEAFRLGSGFRVSALWALFVLTLRQHIRGKKILFLSLLYLLPSVLVVIILKASRSAPSPAEAEFWLLLNLIPHALAPLTALLYAAGIIQDEVEEQTLTYLLLRPLPRWALYIVKLVATILVTGFLTGIFTGVAILTIYLVSEQPWVEGLVVRWLTMAELMALAQVGYCAGFGFLGLVMRRSLIIGVGYILLFEGLLASLDTVARRLTVMYYFRVLAIRWLEPEKRNEWAIDLETAYESQTCILVLLGVGLVFTLLGAVVFARKEFRVKTPEGN